jgi:hypothetical protein
LDLQQDRSMPDSPAENGDHRVISFRRDRGKPAPARQRLQQSPPVDDLQQFERTEEPDDYRHRMLTNVAAAAVTLLLMFAGLWLADALSAMRKNQDCVLSGRRGCTPVDAPVQPRGDVSSPQQR